MVDHTPRPGFPIAAGILFGLGLGGFFDGIVLHQLLQWHHMVSSWYPPTTIENLQLNTTWDGIFHAGTYLFVVAGLYVLWRSAHGRHLRWSNRQLVGTLLLGWGLFNLIEGLVDHEWLGLHHVNEVAPAAQRGAWDMGFLIWGAAMLAAGWVITRVGIREAAHAPLRDRAV
ncbi:conserved membrane hypothetical protein [Bradyrhizobium sp. ORS 375]|uniref:DUF2243 domain-containing protein n=1 Tax=Bradyrhizobium sp. (strain ORS 375) TaxID=566679 RepID=UPI0002405D68|nr:DUF2243 domain-containing protein [Bradyrhizobium sp. ORS 375]CCD91833.1 conserved membrane hypothetical protein [Bradyrhizobium sp. ORS 375]